MTSENKTYQSKNNCENSIHKNQEMDYQRPPSNRVKIAPARYRSNEETCAIPILPSTNAVPIVIRN